METRKLTKEDIDKVRHIDGFPTAKDDDIIALSNAPYYTACPNPFIEDFIKEYGKIYDEKTDDYHREPFAFDVSEGKTDPIYMAHAYHTKVPYKAIMRYILHYTNPGDIVFDGFCGTGMTGVAAQMCENPDLDFRYKLDKEMPGIKWGGRKAVLNDLAPIATFISHTYNTPVNADEFEIEAKRVLAECEKECAWMYETEHSVEDNGLLCLYEDSAKGKINYVVWSDVFICPNCGDEIVFWDAAVDLEKNKISDNYVCKSCGLSTTKRECKNAINSYLDSSINEVVEMSKQVPVLINYTFNGKRYEKRPGLFDLQLIEKIEKMKISYWHPSDRMCEGGESRRNDKYGITHIQHFFTKRNFIVLSCFMSKISNPKTAIALTASVIRSSKLYKFTLDRKMGTVSGTLYIPSLTTENSPFKLLERKIMDSRKALATIPDNGTTIVQCASLTNIETVPSNSCDYIFTDPPFGDNLNYSELSFIWEVWLKVYTNIQNEAIVNKHQKKGLVEYQHLMTECFKEYYRVLKPNRWMTVEFHNSKNAVWNAIQESLLRAGFIIADVRTLDKQQGSFKQVNNNAAVKQDLVISAYKPKESFRREFIDLAGSADTAWSFTHQHLDNLPIVVISNAKIELIAERQAFLLFDRMVAYHIMNGIAVPMDAIDFYKGLDEKFLKRDGMYFLSGQVNEYDTARITNDLEPIQFELFVTNEKSAIAWLYQQLDNPQTYAELQPKFMQEIKAWDKFEERPELNTLLEENFLQNEEGKWYVPDVTKAADVIKLREKKLLKEFEGYLTSKGKLKLFRAEAVRVGFAKLWTDKNYKLIVETADRLPESVIQEDDKLLMYYDISLGRI